ncbi:acetate--CoA ligase family protein [Actinosynnema sp. NPDC053489]|uniref:acetate--CoA ligase family protein n=1 Tax=Actinosynnema sp. NPDC053489 TaxID=3363916 RepID=UPI0037C9FF0A
MSTLSLLWRAESVAVIGATERPGALGRKPVDYLRRYGYPGRVLPINPKGGEILGYPAYPSVLDAPGPIDLALIMVSAERVPAAVDDCVAAGIKLAIIASSGFAEVGDEGAALQAETVSRARAGGLRLIGPNCIGSVGFRSRVLATFSPLFSAESVVSLEPGGLGIVSQSGALGFGAASLGIERGMRPGWVVTTGNDADVSALEVLAALAGEPDCTALLGYLENVPDIDLLRSLAASGKPVALVKSGRSAEGGRAAASHTGALATDDRVLDAALRQLGIVRADGIDELLDAGDAFATPLRPKGPRVAIVTTSGGSGILAADDVVARGLRLSELRPETREVLAGIVPSFGSVDNPVDVTAAVLSDSSLFERSLAAIAADDTVDMIIGCFCVMTDGDVDKAVHSLARTAQASGKPVLVSRTGADFLAPEARATLRRIGLPEYPTPARAVRAAAALWQVSRPRPAALPPATTAVPAPGAEVTEPELKALLTAAGLRVPAGRVVASAEEAASLVAELGGRAVVKAVVPGLVHKTDVGAVKVGVGVADAAAAYEEIAAFGGRVLVEELVEDGVELLVGVRSADFGPVLTVGLGGIFTEVLDDVTSRLLPLGEGDAEAMLGELRGSALLTGARGRRAVDVAAAADVLRAVSALTADWGPGFELDLNPVRLLPDRAVVLDAAFVTTKES